MALARYWRVCSFDLPSGSLSLSLAELRFADAAGIPIDATASITASVSPASGDVEALIDDDMGTGAAFPYSAIRNPGFNITYDFAAPVEPQTVLLAELGASTGSPCFFVVSSSPDQINWTAEAEVAISESLTPGVLHSFGLNRVYAKTVLLLAGRGADGSTQARDESINRTQQSSVVGSAKVSAAQSKFGGTSLSFSGTSGFLFAPSSNWQFDLEDFTVDCWVHPTASGRFMAVGGQWANAFNHAWSVHITDTNVAAFLFRSGTTDYAVVGATVLTTGSWHHIRVCRQGDALRLFVNGSLESTRTGVEAQSIGNTDALAIGYAPTVGDAFAGFIDEFRIVKGIAVSASSFTPPSATEVPDFRPNYAMAASKVEIAVSTEINSGDMVAPSRPQLLFDIENGGRGFISGTVKRDADPVDMPLRRRVRLHRDIDGQKVRETWSDATTGAYLFDEINEAYRYTAIAYDHLHDYRAVVADNLTPEVMP